MTAPAIIGLDLGTAMLGVVVARPAVPLHVLVADTPKVNKHDLDATAGAVRALVDRYTAGGTPPDIVAEFGKFYPPNGATPQQIVAMAANHALMTKLLDLICAACPGPYFRVATIARRTWSSRVVPHHAGGVSNADATAGLAQWLDPEGAWPLLADQHRRDAAGALIGYLRGPNERAARQGRRRASERTKARAAHDARCEALLEAGLARVAEEAAAHPVGYSGRRY